jgi:hypothetical protein
MGVIQFYGFIIGRIGESIDGVLVGIILLKTIKKRITGT